MNDTIDLAIIIPAFKPDFFRAALESIAKQTNKRFKLYIGDDASVPEIREISESFSNTINMNYHRFDANMGGKDLVAQWERCIDLIGNETWIWLFSDDDIMESGCVEAFYQALTAGNKCDLYKFPVAVINEHNQVKRVYKNHKDTFPVIDIMTKKWRGNWNSFVVEFIFNKDAYLREGKFQNFDLAWHSDDATWLKIGRNGVKGIAGAQVMWRESAVNITPQKDLATSIRKIEADLEFTTFVLPFLPENGTFEKIVLSRWFLASLSINATASKNSINTSAYITEFAKRSNQSHSMALLRAYYFVKNTGNAVRHILSK